MDGVHEMAAELFIRIMVDRQGRGLASAEDATDAARDSYLYARAFFEEHGRHLDYGVKSQNHVAGSTPTLRIAGMKL